MRITVGDRSVNLATGGVPLGDDDRPLVLLVHGAGMDRSVWSQQTRFLAHHGYRAAAVDLPGHGETDGPTMTTIDGMGTWVAEVAEHLGSPAHLVGHSMGSLIVLAAAAAYPEDVASAVLIGVAANMPVHPDLQGAADDGDHLAGKLIAGWGHSPDQHLGGNPTPGLWMMGGTRAVLDRSPSGALGRALAACADYDGAVEAAAAVACPVTLILAGQDRMTPRPGAQSLIDALSDPTVVELPETGHMAMIEEPDVVRKAIFDHLARC